MTNYLVFIIITGVIYSFNNSLKHSLELGIALIIIPGNHDSAQRLGFASKQMQQSGLYILGDLSAEPLPVVLNDAFGAVAFWGLPYANPASVCSALNVPVTTHNEAIKILSQGLIKQSKQSRNVVLSHCFIDGASESESERPLSIGGADRVDWQHFDAFDYVALGHLHGRQFKGKACIRDSGSPLKYSFSEERHTKSVVIVDMDARGECTIEQVELKPLRNMRSITGTLAEILASASSDAHADDYLMIKLVDKQAILDVMVKLRAVYPNVLHLERPGLMALKQQTAVQPAQLNANEISMFKGFFQQVTDRQLSIEEVELVSAVIDDLHHAKDEALNKPVTGNLL